MKIDTALGKKTFLALLTAVVGCSPGVKKALITERPNGKLASNEILVMVRDRASVDDLKKEFEVSEVSARLGVYSLTGPTITGNEEKISEQLRKRGTFEAVQPNYLRQADDVARPSDPLWLELFAMKNYGQDAPNGIQGKVGADIGALKAWATTKGSKEIVVAVLDTGIDVTHPDLRDNLWINEAEAKGQPGVDDDGNDYPDDVYGWDFVSFARKSPYHGVPGDPEPFDDHGHGTHVAGTIGAVGDNGIGVSGINWNVSLMALKFLNKSGSGSTRDEIKAWEYVIASRDRKDGRGVDVVNCSFGSTVAEPVTLKVLQAVEKAGVLVVAAAGNDGEDSDLTPHFPANYPIESLISVAATDNLDEIASFSNYGFQKVHIAAPGVGITSTYPVELAAKSTDESKQPYRTWSGTSMATPHVVGAAALVLSAHPELKGRPLDVKQALMKSVDWKPQLASRVASGGRLNLARAVALEGGDSPLMTATTDTWTEETYALNAPQNAYPRERINYAWTIKKDGARAVQLHIQRSDINEPYDAALLFDKGYRPIASIPALARDYWMPAVMGDTVYLKFDNGMISTQQFLGERVVDDPAEIDPALESICFQMSDEWTCYVYEKATDPFPNFNSEGVIIDRIRYLPKLSGGATTPGGGS